MRRTLIAIAIAAAVAVPSIGQAKTFRWAAQGDILTFDPHSQNEGMTIAANSYVYEPLVDYDKDFKVVPRLATEWQQVSPMLYRFKLRPGVKFHDGAAFTADDVVFSVHRAMAPTSNYKAYTTGIKEARKIDDLTVEIETTAPNPVLLRQLPNVFIMNKAWSEKNNIAKPQDFVNKEETYGARNTNGTGPYKLKSREVDVRTVFEENKDWWNKAGKVGNVTEVVFTPIKQNATRTAALLSGEIDFVLDPAAQDLDRLRQSAKVVEGNEYRTIYLGLDQKRPELQYSNIKGKNPFQDIRVREALYRAIDVDAIKRAVMRGLSAPTGTMIAPQVHGWTESLHKRVPYDPEKARALLKEAGYDGTLNFTLDCPNNRYINDEAICQAVVGMWAKVGVKATMNAMPRSTYFPKVQSSDTSAYLFGWGVPTFDAMYTLQNLIRTKGEGADGMYNLGNYSNKELDAIIDRIKTETDAAKRDADIHKVLEVHAKEFGHIPLHDQVIPWAMRKNVSVIHRADNRLVADWVKVD
ncbi:ABC transporter substrate-binding protein [Achromobacter xylosoxidans]